MRRISRAVRVSAFLLASAVCAGAAGAAPVFMKFDGVDVPGQPGTGEIEIHSFHWGPRQSTSADGSRSRTGNQVMMDDKAGREKLQPGGGSTAQKDMVLKGSSISQNATAAPDANEKITIHGGRTEGDPDRPIIAGSVPNAEPLRPGAKLEVRVSKPLDQGSVWIRVSSPWAACRVGTRYPRLELGDGAARYQLSEVMVTRCAADGAGLNYKKVTVRGWDPARKEE